MQASLVVIVVDTPELLLMLVMLLDQMV